MAVMLSIQCFRLIYGKFLPPISLIRDFSNQNARGNVSKISVNHTDNIPYTVWRCFILSRGNFKIGSYKLLEGKIIL